MTYSRGVRRSEYVAEQVVDLITTQKLRSRDLLLAEAELMHHMAVGRASVWDALWGLSVLGPVEVRLGQGTFVRSPIRFTGPAALYAHAVHGAKNMAMHYEHPATADLHLPHARRAGHAILSPWEQPRG